MTYHSDEVLVRCVQAQARIISALSCPAPVKTNAEVLRDFLVELQERRDFMTPKPLAHVAVTGKNLPDGRVSVVICACGEMTHYKVPLNTLDDFQCPKEERK